MVSTVSHILKVIHPTNLSVLLQNGQSPLLVASEQGHVDIVKILLQNHARVDVFDEVTFAPN